MIAQWSLISIIALVLVVSASPLHCKEAFDASTTMHSSFFKPLREDSLSNIDCDYCHGIHNAGNDTPALLNDNEAHYSDYINNRVLSGEGLSRYDWGEERKCPRGKGRNRR